MLPTRAARLPILLGVCACAWAQPSFGAPPPLELVETRPVESRLGNPALPAADSVWVTMIETAQATVDLEHFYLSHWPNEPTGPVLDAIGRAAKRGVRVRLMLDARMHDTYPQPADSLGGVPGVEVRLLDMKKVSGGGVQHAKFMIVDGKDVFVGSQNFDWRSLKHVHELGVRARDTRIAGLFARVFDADWEVATRVGGTALSPSSPMRATPLPSLPIRIVQATGDTAAVWPTFSPRGHIPDPALWDLDAIVRLLDGARSEVAVQLLTYGLGSRDGRDSTLDMALRRAAGRGVRVRLIVSDWEADNARIGDLQRLSQVPGVEVKLSTVPEWSRGYIPFARVEHCKYLVVDTLRTWVGTSNWEPDYFLASRNAALTIEDRPLARQARAVFEASWRSETAIPLSAGRTYERKTHRETPPPGRAVYGR